MIKEPKRLLILLGAVLIQVPIGAIYSWSLFNEELHHKFNWEINDIIYTFSITIFVFAFTTMFSGRLLDRFGARIIATIGGILYGAGLILTSRADTLLELYLYYGVIAGLGVGFVYVCPLATSIKWFPRNKGLVTGIVVGAFGIGSLVFKETIQSFILNHGVSESFFRLGIIYLTLIVLGAQFLKEPKENSHPSNNIKLTNRVFRVRDMLKTTNFYLIWVAYLFGCIGGLLIIGSAMEIGLDLAHLTFEKAAMSISIMAIFNASGRLFWGSISDKIGYKKSAFIMFVITSISILLLSKIDINQYTFYLFLASITFCFGGFLVIFPTITSEYFGTVNIGRNYGVIYQAYGIAALCGPIILKSTNDFNKTFIISSILSAIGALLILRIRK